MVQQALVDVADLFDVQGAEGEAAGFGGATARDLHLEELEGLQEVEHGAVMDRQRLGGRCQP
jgi:hypothetical protein